MDSTAKALRNDFVTQEQKSRKNKAKAAKTRNNQTETSSYAQPLSAGQKLSKSPAAATSFNSSLEVIEEPSRVRNDETAIGQEPTSAVRQAKTVKKSSETAGHRGPETVGTSEENLMETSERPGLKGSPDPAATAKVRPSDHHIYRSWSSTKSRVIGPNRTKISRGSFGVLDVEDCEDVGEELSSSQASVAEAILAANKPDDGIAKATASEPYAECDAPTLEASLEEAALPEKEEKEQKEVLAASKAVDSTQTLEVSMTRLDGPDSQSHHVQGPSYISSSSKRKKSRKKKAAQVDGSSTKAQADSTSKITGSPRSRQVSCKSGQAREAEPMTENTERSGESKTETEPMAEDTEHSGESKSETEPVAENTEHSGESKSVANTQKRAETASKCGAKASASETEDSCKWFSKETVDKLRLRDLTLSVEVCSSVISRNKDCLIDMDWSTMEAADIMDRCLTQGSKVMLTFNMLQDMLASYGSVISRRWSQRRRHDRERILGEAWPGMPGPHRPDLCALQAQHFGSNLIRVNHGLRFIFMLPHMNREDLLDGKNLLSLLWARGAYHPSFHAASDAESMSLGLARNVIKLPLKPKHTMFLHCNQPRRTYGQLVRWDDSSLAHFLSRSRLQYSPGEGACILEIQLKIQEFLLRVCKELVPCEPPDQSRPDDEKWSGVYMTPIMDKLQGPSLGTRIMTAPFQPPKQMNIERIVTVLEALGGCSANHLLSFRSDPGYFNEWLRDAADHHIENILDKRGQIHPHLTTENGIYFWARVIRTSVMWTYFAADIHPMLARVARELQKEYSQHETSLSTISPLPKRLEDIVLNLRYFIDRAIRGLLFTFRQCAQGSPPLRRLFCRELRDVWDEDPLITETVPADITVAETQLVRLLADIWDSPKGNLPVVLSPYIDELDR
ncbi:hypothetical protein CDD82_4554 [Ophiocordyceps australis]|uniref:Uncharacterized protein n=1 Tax=Ophiocordyceps australis TaxID=1399860 RepID=A0A2C5Z006_9HYPO|nr:hypothetical protein CDD82_4554 [Ophiocordyceps australis]